MIQIANGRIFIDGKETINPELIGYAFLDYAETNSQDKTITEFVFLIDKEVVKEKYFNYLKENAFRCTSERKVLLDLILEMNDFSSNEFVKKAMVLNVSYPTCYNFLQTCVDSDILSVNPKRYNFKN